MKLTREDIIRSDDTSPLLLFAQGIPAEITRKKYTATLRLIMCEVFEDILEGSFEDRVGQFVKHAKDDPNWARDVLLSLSWKLRERTEKPKDDPDYLNPTSIKTYFKPLRKLLEMNSVSVSWRRIQATYPEKDNILDTKGWTRDEISVMLRYVRNPMERVLVLVLASSGMRLGGLALKWGDLTPIYLKDGSLTVDPGEGGEVACVALNVYAGSPQNYTAFATPEAYRALLEWGRAWAEHMKRQPKPGDDLFLATKILPRKASEPVIAQRLRRIATAAGLRDQRDKKGTRFQVQLVHGFRKFFNKTCKEALSGDSLASLIRTEYMMGHQGLVSLDQNYFKTSMLEMAAVYVKVVPDLTIDDADRLRHSARRMSTSIQEMEAEKDDLIAQLEKREAEKDARIAQLEEKVRKMELRRLGVVDAKERLEKLVEEIRISNERDMRRLMQEYRDATAREPPKGDGRPRAGQQQA